MGKITTVARPLFMVINYMRGDMVRAKSPHTSIQGLLSIFRWNGTDAIKQKAAENLSSRILAWPAAKDHQLYKLCFEMSDELLLSVAKRFDSSEAAKNLSNTSFPKDKVFNDCLLRCWRSNKATIFDEYITSNIAKWPENDAKGLENALAYMPTRILVNFVTGENKRLANVTLGQLINIASTVGTYDNLSIIAKLPKDLLSKILAGIDHKRSSASGFPLLTFMLSGDRKVEVFEFFRGQKPELQKELFNAILQILEKGSGDLKGNLALVNEFFELFPSFKTEQHILGLFEAVHYRLKVNRGDFEGNLAMANELFERFPSSKTEKNEISLVEALGVLLSDQKNKVVLGTSKGTTESGSNWRMDWESTTYADEVFYPTRPLAKQALLELAERTDSQKVKERINILIKTAPPETDYKYRSEGWHSGNV